MKHLKAGNTQAVVAALIIVLLIVASVLLFLIWQSKQSQSAQVPEIAATELAPAPEITGITEPEEIAFEDTAPPLSQPEPQTTPINPLQQDQVLDAIPRIAPIPENGIIPEVGGIEFVPNENTAGGASLIEKTNPRAIVAEVKQPIPQENLEVLFADLDGMLYLSDDDKADLKRFVGKYPKGSLTAREVGELELNRKTRWAVTPQGTQTDAFLDLIKLPNGEWTIEKVNIPVVLPKPSPIQFVDAPDESLTVADNFVKAVIEQNFEKALQYTDSTVLSDERIASLCIIFEEGDYRLRTQNALRSIFKREGIAAYMANIQSMNLQKKGQFGLVVKQKNNAWKVEQINLDNLLTSYVDKVSDGDTYYTPLVKNPEGGDTLALYFEVDKDSITRKAHKQLGVVSKMLLSDPNKKLTLSGHTDDSGPDDYNDSLSYRRAESVRNFIIQQGVAESQINILAYGETKPRRKNDTEQGRKANRRTEIYLDF